MFERLSKDGRQFEVETRDHIKRYAEAGLRTLVVTYRELDEEEYKLWDKEFSKVKTSVTEDRDALVDAAADKMERDLILLGATAVEDRLQKGVSTKFLIFLILIMQVFARQVSNNYIPRENKIEVSDKN